MPKSLAHDDPRVSGAKDPVVFTLRLSKNHYQRLKLMSEIDANPVQFHIRRAITEYMAREGSKYPELSSLPSGALVKSYNPKLKAKVA